MLREPAVERLVHLVEHEVQQVEPRYERRREVDVARGGHGNVVLGPDGIGGCKDERTRIECGDDASFRDGDCLLFLCGRSDAEKKTRGETCHDFVQHAARRVGYLVELVEATHTAITQHQRTALEHQLL